MKIISVVKAADHPPKHDAMKLPTMPRLAQIAFFIIGFTLSFGRKKHRPERRCCLNLF
jgi:hypothetical protein